MTRYRLTYEVTTWESTTFPRAKDHRKVYRKDLFAAELYRQAYAMLEAEGLLDRPVAWRVMGEVDTLADAYAKPLRPGYYRRDTIWLRDPKDGGKHILVHMGWEG